jgi:hypothetical protein
MRRIEDHLSVVDLRRLFICDAAAGLLLHRRRDGDSQGVKLWNQRFEGKVAGRQLAKGHIQIVITVDGVRNHVPAHRVIWAMTTGSWPDRKFDIDHINNCAWDNRLSNLRLCLPIENAKNRRLYRNNKSGFKGVCWVERYQKWGVQIQVDGTSLFKGYYDDPQIAALAYDNAATTHFGEFAKTNSALGLLA